MLLLLKGLVEITSESAGAAVFSGGSLFHNVLLRDFIRFTQLLSLVDLYSAWLFVMPVVLVRPKLGLVLSSPVRGTRHLPPAGLALLWASWGQPLLYLGAPALPRKDTGAPSGWRRSNSEEGGSERS